MAFEGLSERLQNTFAKLRGKGKVTKADVQEMMREVRLALLEADVNFDVTKNFIKTVQERAVGSEVLDSLTPAQQVIKIVNEELTKIMGSSAVLLNQASHIPTVIMLVGLQGSGKTTSAGKLVKYLQAEKNARPLLIAADVYRPAAIDQLKTIGQQVQVPVYDEGTNQDPVEIVRHGLETAQAKKNDYVLIDTAGRLEIDDQLMSELSRIKQVAQPTEILLVVDSMTGQAATHVAEGFNDRLDISGVILTKLDGDTRGGAALSIRAVTGKPIKFVGSGEKLDALEVFHPDRMADRILGMGDVLTLIEKAEKDYDEKQAAALTRKMQENTFDFNDFVDQLEQMQKMGPMDEIMKMMPGMAANPALKNVHMDPQDIEHLKAVVYSMTPQERQTPELLNPSRRRRIATGSGRPLVEVNRMIKQFKQMQTLMQKMSKGNFNGMEQMMGPGLQGKIGKMAMGSMVRRTKKPVSYTHLRAHGFKS